MSLVDKINNNLFELNETRSKILVPIRTETNPLIRSGLGYLTQRRELWSLHSQLAVLVPLKIRFSAAKFSISMNSESLLSISNLHTCVKCGLTPNSRSWSSRVFKDWRIGGCHLLQRHAKTWRDENLARISCIHRKQFLWSTIFTKIRLCHLVNIRVSLCVYLSTLLK